MAFTAGGGRTGRSRTARSDTADGSDWGDAGEEPRDWKKAALVAGLGLLSWVATYVGMLELIEANVGDLPVTHKVIIGFSVAMLMTMIIWLLDKLFAPIGAFTKTLYALGYVFLSVISVGFGFGFYWKVLESKGEGTRVAETAISQVQAPLQTAAARLETLQRTLEQLKTTSAQKAEQERTLGTSCPNSRPGDGPRRKLREDDAARFTFASDFVRGRIDGVKGDIGALEADLTKITKNDASIVDAKSGTRNDFMRTMSRKLDTTVTNFNAFRGDAQLKQIRIEVAERADKTQFLDTQGKPYSCPDPGLQTMMRSVVASIDALPTLDKPKIATVEGSDATIEAFRRLTASLFGVLSFKLPPSADELRELQKKAIQSVEATPGSRATTLEQAGLSKRDYVPLAIAIFVDICLLLVSMGRPMNRMSSLVPKMRQAERGPVYQILSRFTDIHRDPDIRQNFEIFRHVVFDFSGAYYVAIPLDAPQRANPAERRELQLEAHLLSNLFASFEQEKIFSRVYAPLLSTKAIQKKLWRQGSKFSHSEAFRIYKFKDGAWSEIILGAVMGAARRVEAEKRRMRLEEQEFRAANPTLTMPPRPYAAPANVFPFPPAAPGSRTAQAAPVAGTHQGHTAAGPGSWAPRPPARASSASNGQDPALEAQYGPYALFQAGEKTAPAADRRPIEPLAPTPFAAVASTATSAAARSAPETVVREPQPDARVAEALVSVQHANNNTAPSRAASVDLARSVEPATVLVTEPPRTEPQGINVEMSERTVRFTVPNSEAMMPAGLQRQLGALIARGQTSAGSPPALASKPAVEEIEIIEAEGESAMIDDDAGANGVDGRAPHIALLATRLRPATAG